MVNTEIFPLRSQYARTPAALTKSSALLRLDSRVTARVYRIVEHN